MTRKKKILIISISICLAVAVAVTFITLAFTVWKPKVKTTQEWLNDFKACFAMQRDGSEQKTERSISITEEGTEVANYYQLVEIKNQDDGTVAHLTVTEVFPTLETDEFDTYDEYYFINGTMYMQRIASGETNGTSFGSTWEVFWEVVSENLGSVNYDFTESNFTDLTLTHNGHAHAMSATISDSGKDAFLAGAEGIGDMGQISVSMTLDDETGYFNFKINYTYLDKQTVTINIIKSEPAVIETESITDKLK